MDQLNITHLNTFLNTQIRQHEDLAERLTHVQHLIDFTASSDLKHPEPLQLNAQLIAIEKSIKEIQDLNEHLQATLVNYKPTENIA